MCDNKKFFNVTEKNTAMHYATKKKTIHNNISKTLSFKIIFLFEF